jgi:glycine oxidase
MQVDFIIVGQGIAGITLAHLLKQRQYRYVAYSNNTSQSASHAAAGIIHPITGRRLVKSWMFDTAYPVAIKTYRQMEQWYDISLFNPLPILEIFTSIKNRNDWQMRGADDDVKHLIGIQIDKQSLYGVNMPLGAIQLNNTGFLQTAKLINCSTSGSEVIHQPFDLNQLHVSNTKVIYQDITARFIVFCEGVLALNNPHFDALPFQLSKGEIIEIYCPGLTNEFIINRNHFILPVGNQLFKVGSTYKWDCFDNIPTQEARNNLEEAFKSIIQLPYEVTNHWAAVRPTVKDRRPIAKWQNRLGIINGLGTKGVLLAPYMAGLLLENMPFE